MEQQLFESSKNGDVAKVKSLINKGVDVEAKDPYVSIKKLVCNLIRKCEV